MKKIILASGSPRRSELMRQVALKFDIIPSDCDENVKCPSPEDTAAALSELKCRNVAVKLSRECISDDGYIVIGADTIVVSGTSILGKPADTDDAYRMLKSLSGRTHTVYTGVTIYNSVSSEYFTFTEHTDVVMYELDDLEIWDYISTGEPMDKAGSYGIQGRGAALIKEIHGDYFTVVGLPVARLLRELKRIQQ